MKQVSVVIAVAAALQWSAADARELSTDRPDITESPYTVERGRVQLELDAVAYTTERVAGAGTLANWSLVPINLKLGLGSRTDAQLLFESFRYERLSGGAPTETRSGAGDLTLRLKHNLWGDDEGRTAFALMPFVSIPTAAEFASEELAGGLIAPLAVALSERTSLGLMLEFDWLPDGDASGHHPEWLGTSTIARELAGPLAGFLELTALMRPAEEGGFASTLDAGMTLALGPDAQLDFGAYLGLNPAADDGTVFIGFSVRR